MRWFGWFRAKPSAVAAAPEPFWREPHDVVRARYLKAAEDYKNHPATPVREAPRIAAEVRSAIACVPVRVRVHGRLALARALRLVA